MKMQNIIYCKFLVLQNKLARYIIITNICLHFSSAFYLIQPLSMQIICFHSEKQSVVLLISERLIEHVEESSNQPIGIAKSRRTFAIKNCWGSPAKKKLGTPVIDGPVYYLFLPFSLVFVGTVVELHLVDAFVLK
jgi:hypothetical protein